MPEVRLTLITRATTLQIFWLQSAPHELLYLFKCWGGRASDKHITSCSGFLDHLINGDVVMADSGFDITEDLAL